MGGLLGGGGGSSSTTTTTTKNETTLNNDTDISVVFDFEEMAKVYRDKLNFDIEQSLAQNDGEFTDQQKIEIAKIAMEEKTISLQEKSFNEQIRNNRILLYVSLIGLYLTYLGLNKNKKRS
ncbi:hypothetical protein [Halarcobacter ebronensis]|uniref:Uncharacterized protein n=1 Tax=Halarcobacter ebronensis TaxID=1462615 RepID=A0A4Q1ALI3_9BACT|nr:hypothetical protein [Halarcobacter ebronensis]QKF82055.1 hypothetical protein AEBR_1572 [Halarcobacter ebronensis]RXK04112.1 hypothetical protein CRV07_11845 [Halarcobacter ebronensis]